MLEIAAANPLSDVDQDVTSLLVTAPLVRQAGAGPVWRGGQSKTDCIAGNPGR